MTCDEQWAAWWAENKAADRAATHQGLIEDGELICVCGAPEDEWRDEACPLV